MTSAISSPGVWPEERLRPRLQESSHSLLLSVGDLAVRLRRPPPHVGCAAQDRERARRAAGIAFAAALRADPGATVTLSYHPDRAPKAARAEAAPPEVVVSSDRWELTAPESYVLRHLQDGHGGEAFRLAVVELVARGALRFRRVEKKRVPGWTYRRAVLCEGPRRNEVAEPALLPVLEMYDSLPKRTFVPGGRVAIEGGEEIAGVLIDRFARESAKKLKPAFMAYRDGIVGALLVERGLLRFSGSNGLPFSKPRMARTAAGSDARAELISWVFEGRDRLEQLLDEDPPAALTHARMAGPALFLMADMAAMRADLAVLSAMPSAPAGAPLDLGALHHLDLSVFNSLEMVGAGLAGGGGAAFGGGGGCGGGDGGGGGGGC
jgi:hypothetical protein